jgi:hypothetical protein
VAHEVKAAGVKKRDGSAYVPVKRNVSLLREDVNALDEAVRLWSDEDAEGTSPGYDAIVEQAGNRVHMGVRAHRP